MCDCEELLCKCQKEVSDEPTPHQLEEEKIRAQIKHEKKKLKKLEHTMLREEGLEEMRNEISDRLKNGESLMDVFASYGVKRDDPIIKSAVEVAEKKKKEQKQEAKKNQMRNQITNDKNSQAAQEEAAAIWRSRGPEFYLPLIGSSITFIGIFVALWKCLGVTGFLYRKYLRIRGIVGEVICQEEPCVVPRVKYKLCNGIIMIDGSSIDG